MEPKILRINSDELKRGERLAMKAAIGIALIVGIALFSRTVHAQEPSTNAAFEAGSAEDQMVLDVTPVPVGMGAIFLPSLTDPTLEPAVVVMAKGRRVTSVALGQRAILPPGEYEVVVGQGPVESRPRQTVTVIDGVTTPVEPFYAALRVEIVAPNGEMRPTNYLLAYENGTVLGPIESAELPTYESSKTWLVKPGMLSIVLGNDAGADKNRILLNVERGKVLRYRIVYDDDRIVRTEFADTRIVAKKQWWKLRWTIGADASFNSSSNQLSNYNGDILRFGGFTDAEFEADVSNNIFSLKLGVDQSWVGLDSQQGSSLPFQKIVDEASAELLYTYRLGGIVGPYTRVRGRTALFQSNVFVDQDTTVTRPDRTFTVEAGNNVRLFNPFEPAFINVGAGLGIEPVDNQFMTIFLRGGVGNRWAIFGGGYHVTKRDSDSMELTQLEDASDLGLEADAALEVRLLRSLRLSASAELFVPQNQIFESDKNEFTPEYRFSGFANLSLNSFASVIYRISVHRDSTQIDDLQMMNGLQLRIQHSFF